MIDFHGSTLLVSPRSPFARRVRLAFREAGLRFEERILQVIPPSPELNARNPLGRVPTLVLSDGGVLVESSLILQLFHENHPSALDPREPGARVQMLFLSGLAIGLMEKAIEWFFEGQKQESLRDPALLDEVRDIYARVMPLLEGRLQDGRESLIDGGLTQADLDVTTALTYGMLRVPELVSASRYPKAAFFREKMEARTALRETFPPAT